MVLFLLKIPIIVPIDVAFPRFQEAVLSTSKLLKISKTIFGILGLFKKFLFIAFYLVKLLLNWTFFDFLTHCVWLYGNNLQYGTRLTRVIKIL